MATTTLTGTTGNDILNAPGSVTTLVAGYQGNDTITLVLSGDEAQAGAGNDSIAVNVSGTAAITVAAGAGNDSVTLSTAQVTNSGIIGLNEGDDLFSNTGTLFNGGSLTLCLCFLIVNRIPRIDFQM